MNLTQRLHRAMTRLGFELHFFTLTADRQRVLLFLESRDDGAVVEGRTMADCIEALEREAALLAGEPAPRRAGPAVRRAERLGFRVIDGGRDPERREGS
ncbi:MAG TPA: hypothetical protein VIM86_09315 [Thermodesulfobacteriota bacterium]